MNPEAVTTIGDEALWFAQRYRAGRIVQPIDLRTAAELFRVFVAAIDEAEEHGFVPEYHGVDARQWRDTFLSLRDDALARVRMVTC